MPLLKLGKKNELSAGNNSFAGNCFNCRVLLGFRVFLFKTANFPIRMWVEINSKDKGIGVLLHKIGTPEKKNQKLMFQN